MKGSRTVAIVQARMSSRRLPGKVLLDIAGKPMLARVVERARRARTLDEVLVATTTDPADQAIVEQCEARQYPYFRGSLHDVLDRYYQAALSSGAQNVVRLTADCPLIDPQVIDQTVRAFLGLELGLQEGGSQQRRGPQGAEGAANTPWDFAANRLPPPFSRTFPIGLDTEVCTFAALERAWREAHLPHQREHVMPYLYEDSRVVDWRDRSNANPGGRFRALLVNHDPDYGHLRWTVDTHQDLDLVRAIYTYFGGRDDFSWLEVLTLFEKEPSLAQVNASVPAKYVHESEMKGS